ncbi:MAG: hypothetical protein MZW92_76470 [Comamonadaceae bacterium]|nr:hypothetical protein [Comamonadaceae bacterium]
MKDLKPGVSTGFDVRDRMGTPTLEWRNADGSVTWEFARTPEGKVNYMVTIGPDNILREIRQVLTEENFAKVREGHDARRDPPPAGQSRLMSRAST